MEQKLKFFYKSFLVVKSFYQLKGIQIIYSLLDAWPFSVLYPYLWDIDNRKTEFFILNIEPITICTNHGL